MFSTLIWLAMGSFAIGTQSFMLAGILPQIAGDLGVSQADAGQLVTGFALVYAIGAPIIAVVTANLPRKGLLVGAMAAFALANVWAALAPNYAGLMGARLLLGLTAATFMPAATGAAAAVVPVEQRGRALAFLYSGMTIATIVGVPLGTLAADYFGWRSAFWGVGAMSAVALAGCLLALPALPNGPAASLRARIKVAGRRDVLALLSQTTLVMSATFALFTFIGATLVGLYGISTQMIALALAGIGVMGAIGNGMAGVASDRIDRDRFIATVVVLLAILHVAIGLTTATLGASTGLWVFVGLILLMGLVGWSFPAVQQARIIALDPPLATITLSLNATAIYLGTALGAALGSTTINVASIRVIGFTSFGLDIAALLVTALTATSLTALVRGRRAAPPV